MHWQKVKCLMAKGGWESHNAVFRLLTTPLITFACSVGDLLPPPFSPFAMFHLTNSLPNFFAPLVRQDRKCHPVPFSATFHPLRPASQPKSHCKCCVTLCLTPIAAVASGGSCDAADAIGP